MSAIPLHRVHILNHFVTYLQDMGGRIEHGLARAKLPGACIEEPEAFVPSLGFYNFVAAMSEQVGVEELGFLVGQSVGANLVSDRLEAALQAEPTLYHGLIRLQRTLEKEASRAGMRLSPVGADRLRVGYYSSFGPEHVAHYSMMWFSLMGLIATIRVFTGPSWQPLEIGFEGVKPPGQMISNCFPRCRMYAGTNNYVDIDVADLSSPPQKTRDYSEGPSEGSKVAHNLQGSLELLLSTYQYGQLPSINQVAEFAGLSVRSLQRQLKDSGLNFRTMLASARYQGATRLLDNPDARVEDIAYQLGYAHPTHFSRAFRRFSGVSPLEYRNR
jgi:AraC-like DNA-binding protein